MSTTLTVLEESLLKVWNSRNSNERQRIMERIYAPDIAFYEDDNSEPYVGINPINELIEKLQQPWPADFEFTLVKPLKVNHNVQHATWSLGQPGAQPVATGIDVAVIENGKIKALYLFMDK